MMSYLLFITCSLLALQADGMEDFVDKPQTERCRPYGCGEYIITGNGKSQPNKDGECQKQQPAAGTYWYAMQSQKLCQRWIWPGPQVSIKPCWCVVPKCKPVRCGTRAAPAGSKCYHEKQPNMECKQSGNLCKEITDPKTGDTKPCYCCWERDIQPASGCKDNGCGRFWQGKGECVNATSIAFSKIEAEYDLRYSNAYYNKRCAPADSTSDKDCCLCLRKKPCVDKGCIEKGGMCVDMKNARLSNPNYGPRSEVDLDSPLGDDLCANDPSTTVVGQNKQCCTCYKKKEN